MREVFIYACDVCDAVKMNYRDTGSVWCTMCSGCKECQFHNKVTLGKKYVMGEWVYMLTVEEKKDGDSDKRTNKKA